MSQGVSGLVGGCQELDAERFGVLLKHHRTRVASGEHQGVQSGDVARLEPRRLRDKISGFGAFCGLLKFALTCFCLSQGKLRRFYLARQKVAGTVDPFL